MNPLKTNFCFFVPATIQIKLTGEKNKKPKKKKKTKKKRKKKKKKKLREIENKLYGTTPFSLLGK
jgi:hypothetical protein